MNLVIAGLLVGAVGVVMVFGVLLTMRSKREFAEQNQAVPGRPSPAPVRWAGADSREAGLHRRLGDAVAGARANPRFGESGLGPQMQAIEAEALGIDERLVVAARTPTAHRDAAIDPVEQHIANLEAAIADLVGSTRAANSKVELDDAVSAADSPFPARAEVEPVDRRASAQDLGTESDTPTP